MRLRIVLLLVAVLGVVGIQPAWAAPTADKMTVHIKVDSSGLLHVTSTAEVTDAAEVTWTLPLTRDIDSTTYYRYQVDTDTEHTTGPGALVATAPVTDGKATLTYTVRGATHQAEGDSGPLTVAEWPALTGLDLPVKQIDVSVDGPSTVLLLDCSAGPVGTIGRCAGISGGTYETPEPVFQDGPRDAGDEVLITVGYSPSELTATAEVAERWSLNRAFNLGWPAVLAALGTALIGAALLYLLHRRTGRDLSSGGAVAAIGMFAPTGDGQSVFHVTSGVRPGHVGTVADERVDPIDITATLIDLAAREHLRIVELPTTAHGQRDWRLERTEGADDLASFESLLLDAVAPEGKPSLVSELPTRVAGCIEAVQDALYEDVVRRGWFEERPDTTRSRWRVRGWVGFGLSVVTAGLLIAFTQLGLVALVLMGLGGALVWVADRMPRRTTAGAALLRGLEALALLLATHPTDHMPAGRELPEISHILGYTVVLGHRERWLEAMVRADIDDSPDPVALPWYHAPETWHLRDLPGSLNQFIITVQGELAGR